MADGGKAKRIGQRLPVDGVGGTGKGSGTKGQDGRSLSHLGQSFLIPRKGPKMRENPVSPGDGLGVLQMGVAGHGQIQIRFCAFDERLLQIGEHFLHLRACLHQPEPEVGGDLVVAAAASVQLAAYSAHNFGQAALNGRMNVFIRGIELETAVGQLLFHRIQPRDDGVGFWLRQHACANQSLCPRFAARNILFSHPHVKAQAGVKFVYQCVRAFGKTAAP